MPLETLVMLQANFTAATLSSTIGSSCTPPATYGRLKRGTPGYAAAVRLQIARLAALQAATVTAAPSRPVAIKTILLVSACTKVRQAVREGLHEAADVRVVEVATLEAGLEQLAAGSPNLILIDHAQRELLGGLIHEAPEHRVVLIADTVPRSSDLPRELAGVLARPLKADRVSREVLALLDKQR